MKRYVARKRSEKEPRNEPEFYGKEGWGKEIDLQKD